MAYGDAGDGIIVRNIGPTLQVDTQEKVLAFRSTGAERALQEMLDRLVVSPCAAYMALLPAASTLADEIKHHYIVTMHNRMFVPSGTQSVLQSAGFGESCPAKDVYRWVHDDHQPDIHVLYSGFASSGPLITALLTYAYWTALYDEHAGKPLVGRMEQAGASVSTTLRDVRAIINHDIVS